MQVPQLEEHFSNDYCLSELSNQKIYSFGTNEKKWFLWTMVAAQAAENHGDEWRLTCYFLWGIYTSIQIWNHSKNSLAAAAAAPSLKIS